jgi:hypothetical protein
LHTWLADVTCSAVSSSRTGCTRVSGRSGEPDQTALSGCALLPVQTSRSGIADRAGRSGCSEHTARARQSGSAGNTNGARQALLAGLALRTLLAYFAREASVACTTRSAWRA